MRYLSLKYVVKYKNNLQEKNHRIITPYIKIIRLSHILERKNLEIKNKNISVTSLTPSPKC